jgi:4-hydroxy-3-polyprenylbenzoate decarboxylase
MSTRTVVGITGATGIAFTRDFLKKIPGDKYLILTKWGKESLRNETGLQEKDLAGQVTKIFPDGDLSAPLSSGSNPFDALVILPCSASTLNKIACGIADTLLTRTAMVALKERRKMVLCLRETPLTTRTLKNAAELSAEGVIVMPLMPPYYQNPLTMDGVLAGFTNRLLQVLGHPTGSLWKGGQMEEGES